MSTTKADEADAEPVCGLDDCTEPLPPRPRDALGRPKGGRRARYCSKAHADAASRQRRANDLAAVADPLALAREATAGVLPVARHLSEQLTALMSRFEQAENGALARVQAAESEAAQAHAEAARAAESEQQAEHARREALAAARRDREEKNQALERAQAARTENEQIRDSAWKQVAEHERARGQAEAELDAAARALQILRSEHAELLDQAETLRARTIQLDLQITATGGQLQHAGERITELNDRLHHGQEQHTRQLAEQQRRHQQELSDAVATAQQVAQAQILALRARLESQAADTVPVAKPASAPKLSRRRSRVAGQRPGEIRRPSSTQAP